MSQKITRRRFLQAGAAVLAVAALTACGGDTPSPAPATTARTLGDVTFDIVDEIYSSGAFGEKTDYKDGTSSSETEAYQDYIFKLSVKNGNAKEAAKLSDVKVTLQLEDKAAVKALNESEIREASSLSNAKELRTLVVAPQGSADGYVGFIQKANKKIELQICYLTIEYAKQKVTYKIDGQVITAGAVTNA